MKLSKKDILQKVQHIILCNINCNVNYSKTRILIIANRMRITYNKICDWYEYVHLQECCSVAQPILFIQIMRYFDADAGMMLTHALLYTCSSVVLSIAHSLLNQYCSYRLELTRQQIEGGLGHLLYSKVCIGF